MGKQVELLEHHAHTEQYLGGRLGVGADQIHVVVEYLSTGGLLQQVEAAQEGGLAAAGGSYDGHHLTGLDLNVDAFEHLMVLETLFQPLDADHTHSFSAPRK